jgi:hypothetical protein
MDLKWYYCYRWCRLAFTTVAVGTVIIENQIDVVGRVATGTMLGGAAGALTSYVSRRLLGMHYDIIHMGNSMLVGLTSITASCGVIQPWAAIVIGSVGAILFMGLCKLIARLHIDDPLDAAAVHISGGLWALIATGLFADGELVQLVDDANPLTAAGLFYGGDVTQMGMQLLEAACTIAWGAFTSLIFFSILHRCGKLRVSKEAELGGLDLFKHGARPGLHDEHEYEPSDLPSFSRGKDTRRVDTSNPFNTKPTSLPPYSAAESNRAGLTYLRSIFKNPTSAKDSAPTGNPVATASASEWNGRSRLESVGAPDNVELSILPSRHASNSSLRPFADPDMYDTRPTSQFGPREQPSHFRHGTSPFAAPQGHFPNFSLWQSECGSVDESHMSVEGHVDEEDAGFEAAYGGARMQAPLPPMFGYIPNAPSYPASLPPWQDLYALQNIQMWQHFLESRYPLQPASQTRSTNVPPAQEHPVGPEATRVSEGTAGLKASPEQAASM